MDRAGSQNAEWGMRIAEWEKQEFRVLFRICLARLARRILRKPVQAYKKSVSPADAFCPEGPCPRATTPSMPEM
jgi:hypothetical protein